MNLHFLLICLLLTQLSSAANLQVIPMNMPGVLSNKSDTYLCTSLKLDSPQYIVGFKPNASMMVVHHMLLFACLEPGTGKDVWKCGEMAASEGEAPPCSKGFQILYGWARDAPELKLPEGVGFKVGEGSSVRYLVLQVHYMRPMESEDFSGLRVISTTERMPKRAGILLMVTIDGLLKKQSIDHFETACAIGESVQIHPFAFRVHTHRYGRVVSGWKVQRFFGHDVWTLIGKMNPQLPQMFYPVADPRLTLQKGDVMAARCTMENYETRDVSIGQTGSDEMCNYYLMYYVDGDKILNNDICYSTGPPNYYWAEQGGLNNIPEKEADSL